ncbi:MAG: hypothetical protein JWN17_328, partial [Frankiales bacterium]|nr:hypothetical protein [Frankiales bacterium]
AHTPGAVHAQRLDQVLQGHDPAAVAQAALALEDTDPAAALDLWSRVPGSPAVQVATARCLLQLGRTEQALTAVEGLDVGALELGDLLVVVALAAAAGDRDTAQTLLDSVQEVPPTLRSTVDGLASTLGLVV